MKKTLGFTALVAALVVCGQSSAAQTRKYVSGSQAAALLADGTAWAAQAPDGKALKFTFEKDGSGSIRGPMPFSLSIQWSVKGDDMCITGKMGKSASAFSKYPAVCRDGTARKPT